MLPQHPPPPPWADAAAPQGPPSQVAPWAVASERLNTFTTTQLVDDERGMVPWPGSRWPFRASTTSSPFSSSGSNARPAAVRRPPVPDRLPRRGARQHAAAVPRPEQLVDADRPPCRSADGGRGGLRLHLAAQGRVGRTGARHPVPVLAGLGRRVLVRAGRQPWMPYRAVRDCLPPAPAPAPGAALVDRLAPRGFLSFGGRRLRPLLDRERPSSCPSRLRWRAWPSSPGRPASCWPSRPPIRRPGTQAADRGVAGLSHARLDRSLRLGATRTYELFTWGLRCCCLAFTLPRYGPASG